MSYSGYYRDIPASGNDPEDDQPKMTINANSIDDLINFEHYSFNNNNGGTHKKMTMKEPHAAGGQTLNSSCINSVSSAVTLKPEATFTNANGAYTISAIRAFANMSITNLGAVTLNHKMNVASVLCSLAIATFTITVTLTSNAVIGSSADNICPIFAVSGLYNSVTYTFSSNTIIFVVKQTAPTTSFKFSFQILQV